MTEAGRMSLLLCVGTSFSVGITDLLLQAATARHVPILSIDPGGEAHPSPHRSLHLLPAPAEELLYSLAQDGSRVQPASTARVRP